jgi:sterol desaturase/sphingolipid hydroxylase (fatty acid hydroxylase superfamily)
MNNLIADSESSIRLAIFLGMFLLLAVAEVLFPRRKPAYSKPKRWLSNLSISALNTLVVRISFPIAGVAAAMLAQDRQWGLLNQLAVAPWLNTLIFLLLFDLAIYWQHRLFHVVPWLWRFHRMHHTDVDYDLTTGSRFHPFSILISAAIKIALVIVLGASAAAILIAEVVLNVTAMFNHSNLKLPEGVDRVLRIILVTPDMHRVHHSTDSIEHNSNFGFNYSGWDRLFGSYLDQPKMSHADMDIGINGFLDEKSTKLTYLLIQPFKNSSNP